jgi:tRNA(Ile)-lysidine synthase
VSRQETGDFCRQFGLPIWEDVVNQKLRYARNRLRQVVFPYLTKHFHPQVEKNLAQTVEILTEEVVFLQNLAEDVLQKARSCDYYGLNRMILRDYPLAIQRRVIRLFLQNLLPKMPNFDHIEAVTALINAPNLSCTSSLPGGAIAQVDGVNISLSFSTKGELGDREVANP